MTGILSTISGFFSKPLILGVFLPTVMFTALFFFFAAPMLPDSLLLIKQLETLDTQWKVISVSFTTIVLSGLLYNLNIPIIRLYEGYPWKQTWLGKWRVKRHRERFKVLRNRQRGMRTLLRAMASSDPELIAGTCKEIQGLLDSDPTALRSVREAFKENVTTVQDERWTVWRKEIHSKWAETGRQLLNGFADEHLILPTVLGNVIRSFEYYPDREYGIDTVTLWPRLIAKIDKEYAASIDDAKTGFDFMVNCSALSAMLALMVLLIGLATTVPLASLSKLIPWTLEIFALGVASYLTYLGAINRAPAWGTRVKSAFDLYRNDLLIQLGFNDKPKTKRAERDLWDGISQQLIYGDLPSGPNVDYALSPLAPTPDTYVISNPLGVRVEITRGIRQSSPDNMFQVFLSVRNIDPAQAAALQVVVTDTLPSDWAYQWGSAELYEEISSDFTGFVVTGSNPYLFQVGDLQFNEEKLVSYRAYWRRPL
ncbi:MAG: hypothetical protein QOH70_671 [Blastocatellia bacterium]|jgi:hypothetical protein|nr:hypothetical protein [Blastocatellia bacterium]